MADEPSNALVERLGDGLEVVDEGRFTLAHTEAWKKLGTRRFHDPYSFILLFIEAAVLLGCEAIDIDQQPRATTLRLLGASLSEAERRALVMVAFSSSSTEDSVLLQRRFAGRRALAFGLAAAAFLPVAKRVFRSAGADGSWELGLQRDAHFDFEQVERAAQSPMLSLSLELKGSDAQIALQRVEYEQAARGRLRVIIEHCRFAPIPVRVNGVRYDGKALEQVPTVSVPIRDGELVVGEAFHDPLRRSGTVFFVDNGIVVEVFVIHEAPPGLAARIDAGGLARDLSGLRLRRDERFDEVVAAVTRTWETQLPPLALVPRFSHNLASEGRGLFGPLGAGLSVAGVAGLVILLTGGLALGVVLSALLPVGLVLAIGARAWDRPISIAQHGIPAMATITHILSVGRNEGFETVEVEARLEAPGFPARSERLTLRTNGPHELEVGARYHARLDPKGEFPSFIQ